VEVTADNWLLWRSYVTQCATACEMIKIRSNSIQQDISTKSKMTANPQLIWAEFCAYKLIAVKNPKTTSHYATNTKSAPQHNAHTHKHTLH